jgi:hypothetical protein
VRSLLLLAGGAVALEVAKLLTLCAGDDVGAVVLVVALAAD